MVRVGSPQTASRRTEDDATAAPVSALSLEDVDALLKIAPRPLVKTLMKQTGFGWAKSQVGSVLLKGPSVSMFVLSVVVNLAGLLIMDFVFFSLVLDRRPEAHGIKPLVLGIVLSTAIPGLVHGAALYYLRRAYTRHIRPFLAIVFPPRRPDNREGHEIKAVWNTMEPYLWALAQMPASHWDEYLRDVCADVEFRQKIVMFARTLGSVFNLIRRG
jgi:hypothetical protein